MAVWIEVRRCSCGQRDQVHQVMPDPARRSHLVPAPPEPMPGPGPKQRPIGYRFLDELPAEPPAWLTRRQLEVYTLRMAGYTQTAIAVMTGLSQSMISLELGVIAGGLRRPLAIDTRRIVALRSRGLSQAAIGERLGISQAAVSGRLARDRRGGGPGPL